MKEHRTMTAPGCRLRILQGYVSCKPAIAAASPCKRYLQPGSSGSSLCRYSVDVLVAYYGGFCCHAGGCIVSMAWYTQPVTEACWPPFVRSSAHASFFVYYPCSAVDQVDSVPTFIAFDGAAYCMARYAEGLAPQPTIAGNARCMIS